MSGKSGTIDVTLNEMEIAVYDFTHDAERPVNHVIHQMFVYNRKNIRSERKNTMPARWAQIAQVFYSTGFWIYYFDGISIMRYLIRCLPRELLQRQQLPGYFSLTRPQGYLTPQSPHRNNRKAMSSTSNTPTSAHAASAKKIANYTQSISTGVTNLLTEIGRVSATATPSPASASGTDSAILLQLQALTGQIVGLVNRMDEVQQMVRGLERRLDDMASSPSDFSWELKRPEHLPGAE